MRSQTLAVLVILGCFLLAHYSYSSYPTRSSIRFQEVTQTAISDNSVSNSKLQAGSVSNRNLQTESVTGDKIAASSIHQEHFSPNSVTSGALAIDLVHIHINPTNVVPATGGNPIPDLEFSIKPWEVNQAVNPQSQNTSLADNPNRDNAYRVIGKARGPGAILGWYPAENGHLLRYQSSRALRALTCADTGILSITAKPLGCSCDAGLTGCACSVTWNDIYPQDTVWSISLDCTTKCTTPSDICNLYSQLSTPSYPDLQCLSLDGDYNTYPAHFQPDNCHVFTSVQDVSNPQEGTPVYAPSMESITIDETGLVTLSFFGRGLSLINSPTPPIDIVVVVLLNEQFGA